MQPNNENQTNLLTKNYLFDLVVENCKSVGMLFISNMITGILENNSTQDILCIKI